MNILDDNSINPMVAVALVSRHQSNCCRGVDTYLKIITASSIECFPGCNDSIKQDYEWDNSWPRKSHRREKT